MKVAVIGLGTMGPGIAATLAHCGMQVRLTDKSETARRNSLGQIEVAWNVLEQLNSPAKGRLDGVTIHENIGETVDGVGLVIENVSEDLLTKQNLFSELDRLTTSDCILASDTSGIPVSQLQRGLQNPGRVIGMHWSNPPHIIPIIEVIAGINTDEAVVKRCIGIIRSMSLLPVLVKKDVPGFVENRILYAIMREAVDLVENGVIEAATLDDCVSWGIGYKLSVVGPMALLDMAGLDIYQAVASYLNKDLCNRNDVSPWIRERTKHGHLGMKSGAGVYSYTPNQVEILRLERVKKLVAVRHALSAGPPMTSESN